MREQFEIIRPDLEAAKRKTRPVSCTILCSRVVVAYFKLRTFAKVLNEKIFTRK